MYPSKYPKDELDTIFLRCVFRNLCLALESASKRASRYERQIKDLEVSHLFRLLHSLPSQGPASRAGWLRSVFFEPLSRVFVALEACFTSTAITCAFSPRPRSHRLRSCPNKTHFVPHPLRMKRYIKLPEIFSTRRELRD